MKQLIVSQLARMQRAAAIGVLLLATVIGMRPAAAEELNIPISWQPAMTEFNGLLYIAFVGTNGHIGLISSADGVNFGPTLTIPGNVVSQVGPGMAAFNGRLYLAYDGTDRSHTINYLSSPDGSTWGVPSTFGSNTSTTNPALAGSSNQLLIAWGGNNSGQNINVGCISCTNLPFGSKVVMTSGTCCGVALTQVNGDFFLSANAGGTVKTYSSTAATPLTFTQQATISSSGAGPADTAINGFVYVGWPGPVGNPALNLATYQVISGTGLSFVNSEQAPVGQTSNDNPAVANFNGHLYYAWRDSNDKLSVTEIF